MDNDQITVTDFLSRFNRLCEDTAKVKHLLELQDRTSDKKDRLRTVDEAAEFLQLAKSTIYRLVSDRSIPFKKMGKRLYFLESQLFEWVRNSR